MHDILFIYYCTNINVKTSPCFLWTLFLFSNYSILLNNKLHIYLIIPTRVKLKNCLFTHNKNLKVWGSVPNYPSLSQISRVPNYPGLPYINLCHVAGLYQKSTTKKCLAAFIFRHDPTPLFSFLNCTEWGKLIFLKMLLSLTNAMSALDYCLPMHCIIAIEFWKRNIMTWAICVQLYILVCIGQASDKILCVYMPHFADTGP